MQRQATLVHSLVGAVASLVALALLWEFVAAELDPLLFPSASVVVLALPTTVAIVILEAIETLVAD